MYGIAFMTVQYVPASIAQRVRVIVLPSLKQWSGYVMYGHEGNTLRAWKGPAILAGTYGTVVEAITYEHGQVIGQYRL